MLLYKDQSMLDEELDESSSLLKKETLNYSRRKKTKKRTYSEL